jgi:hypothetical protein
VDAQRDNRQSCGANTPLFVTATSRLKQHIVRYLGYFLSTFFFDLGLIWVGSQLGTNTFCNTFI